MTKSRTLRKAGAVVLSLAMAFSVAGVAPSADAAAKTPALSAKKGTIKVGKKKAVKIKNTTAKKVKKLVVSSNKKAVATVKKNSKVKFTVTGKKAGTAKITAKVTLKKKVAGKKVYTLKYTATVKKAATTPTEAPVVAVTGVTLSNSTPKVGDTISATVEPSNATGLTYAWYRGDAETQVETLIEGATSSSLAVDAALVGKFIKVVVNGENGSSASATTTKSVEAAATDKIAIASAKQTGSATIEVVVNKPITTGTFDIALSKGTTAQTITTAIDEAGTKITITNGVALSPGDYTVKVTSKTDATETASSTVTCEKSELKEIKFLGDQLVLTDPSLNTAKTTLKGYDQFGNEVALTGSLTVTATKGLAEYVAKEAKVTVDATYGSKSTMVFTPGEKITLTAVYTSGATVLQIVKELTVSNMATLTEFEVGELATTKTDLKGKRVTLANFGTNTYYLPVKKANDQYGNALSADELNAMAKDGKGKNLYITPNGEAGSYAYVSGFEKLKDGTLAMKLNLGKLGMPGKAIISITGIGGYQGTAEVTLEDDPHIAKLNITTPNLYSGIPATIDVSAVDQYGDALDMYTKVASDGATVEFSDKNNLTQMVTKMTANYSGSVFTVKKDTAKKTLTFIYTPKAGVTTKHDEVISVVTAEGTASSLTWNVDTLPTPYGLSDLSGLATSFLNNAIATQSLSEKSVQILDSTGAKVNYEDNPGSIADVNFIPAASSYSGLVADKYYATVKSKTNDSEVTAGADATVGPNTVKTVNFNATTAQGGHTVTITLYKAESDTSLGKEIATKDYTFTVVNASDPSMKYSAKIASGDELLYVNKNSGDSVGFAVTMTDSKGNSTAMTSGYNVTVDSNLKVANNKVIGAVDGISAKGTAVARVWVGNEVIASLDINYDVAAPAPQKTVTKKGDTAVNTDSFSHVTSLDLNASGVMTITDGIAGSFTAYVVDQYGLSMANTSWAVNGAEFATKTSDTYTGAVMTATNNKVSGSWTLSGTWTQTASAKTASVAFTGDLEVGANTIAVNAPKAGVLYAMDQYEYNTFKTNGVEPAAGTYSGKATGTIADGDSKDVTLTIVDNQNFRADTIYYLVLTDGKGAQQAFKQVKTEAAALTTISNDSLTLSTVASGTPKAFSTIGATDQFGNPFELAEVTNASWVVPNTAGDGTGTFTLAADGTGSVTLTDGNTAASTTAITYEDTTNGLDWTITGPDSYKTASAVSGTWTLTVSIQ